MIKYPAFVISVAINCDPACVLTGSLEFSSDAFS